MKDHMPDSSGFTLVEVLIGMTLLSLILVILFSGLFTTGRTWEAGDKQAQLNDDHRLAFSFIRRQINQTVPIHFQDDEDSHVIFRGDRDSMSFISTLPAHRGGTGLYQVSLRVTDNAKGESALMFSYDPVTPGIELYRPGETSESQTLITGIADMTISYFGRPTPNDDPAWHNTWQMQEQLPELIRLQLYAEDSDTEWPELYLRVPVQLVKELPQMVLQNPRPL